MKKVSLLVLSFFITSNLWAANAITCVYTTDVLSMGGNPTYDDYLYLDSKNRELRQEGKQGAAYICGKNYCQPGALVYSEKAVVGNANANANAIYECINTSTSGRTSYQWQTHIIQTTCSIKNDSDAQFDNSIKLYKVGKNYCKKVIKETNINDVIISAGNNYVEITGKFADNLTEIFRIFKDGTVQIYDKTGNLINKTIQTLTDGTVKIVGITGKTAIGFIEITKDGIVNVYDISGRVIEVLSDNVTKGYVATLGLFKTLAQETGQTVRAISSDVKDVTVSAIGGGVKITTKLVDGATETFEITKDGLVKLYDSSAKLVSSSLETMKDGTVKVTSTLVGGATRTFEIAKDGTVKVIQSSGDVIKKLSGDGAKVLTSIVDGWNTAIKTSGGVIETIVKNGASVLNTGINTIGNIATTVMNNTTDFAKHFTTEIISGVQALQINKNRLAKLEKDIANCTTQEEVAELIEQALREAELSEAQCMQVQNIVNNYAQRTQVQLNVISGRINSLAQELAELKRFTLETANKIEKLGGQYQNLAALVRTKVNARQVITLITEHTQKFSDGQTAQLYEILAEYTSKLSDGQKAEVLDLISVYVDPKFTDVNTKISMEAKARAANDKVISAMSVLNSFAAAADVSVWKTADGKFNAVRLASDATAGVVLGTAGGLISNSIIKKNQIKKGFESIVCTVGGQTVADYGDEFTVGIQN